MTYAMYRERDEDLWYRLERLLGTTWTYDDVSGPETSGGKALPPHMHVKYPLGLIMSPALLKDVKARFGIGTGPKDFDHGDGIGGAESMFTWDKDKFLDMADARREKKKEDDFDVMVPRPKELRR